jgi:cell division septation protein DedD
MFGAGSPVFAQMPSYTPVTRGPGMAPQAPEPQTQYNPYAQNQTAPMQPPHQPAAGLGYPDFQPASPLSYPTPQPAAAPSYQGPHPGAGPSYQNAQPAAQPNYFDPQAGYQAAEFAPHGYQPANQPAQAPNFAGPQGYQGSNFSGGQGFPSQPFGNQNFGDANFAEPASGDASFPEPSFDQNFADASFGAQDFGKQNFGDANFPEPQGFDANFSDASFPASPGYGRQEQHAPDNMGGFAQGEEQGGQGFDSYAEEPHQDYGSGQVPPSDPRRQLQAFDAIYDQPPQIALGSTEPSRRPAQDFYEGERLDADFLDEGQALPPPAARAKSGMTFKSRSAFMVCSALLGAIALGGALAFAYKQSGGGLGSETPPLVTADSRPVKELPDQPGGKEFPHKNKLIYDRLENGDEPESERLVPRQENVAVPALPPSGDAAGMPATVATTDLGTPTTQAVGGAEPIAVASADDSMPDGGPRKVKTMVVRPDGSMAEPPAGEAAAAEAPAAPAAPEAPAAAEAPQMAAAAPPPAPAAAEPQEVASLQAPPPAPAPKPAAKPVQTAAATPAAAAAPTKYVVQVGSKKNQTDALASFADMQQKYPTLLANYRPMVQKADLGSKGTWYRLRIGPIADKTAATKLCGQLKSQGLPDCLVMAQ